MRKSNLFKDYKRVFASDMHWLSIWALIYICFLSLDLVIPDFIGSSLIKYVGIFLCIIYAYHRYRSDYNLILALLFTFLADTILVWTPLTIAGVYVFCIAQFMHLTRQTKLSQITLSIIACTLSGIFAILIACGLEPLYAIASVYGIELISNVIMSAKNYITNRSEIQVRCAFYGFVLFFACDLCVALRFLALDGKLPSDIFPIAAYLVWVFYLPSQVLIAHSGLKATKFAKSKRIS